MARKVEVVYERASGGGRSQAFVRDASLGGLFIETAAPFDAGTLVSIELTSPSGAKIAVDGRVMSVQREDHGDLKAGMSVRFLDLPDGAASTLGPMFQASRPPARTYLGVGSTEVEIPKAPSVPKVGVPAAGAAAAPARAAGPVQQAAAVAAPNVAAPNLATASSSPSPSHAPNPAAPIPSTQGSPFAAPPNAPNAPMAPMPMYGSSPPPHPSARPPMAPMPPTGNVAMATPARPQTSPILWIVVALLVLLLLGALAFGGLFFLARPVEPPRPVPGVSAH